MKRLSTLLIAACAAATVLAAAPITTLVLDGKPVSVLTVKGRSYVPVDELAKALGGRVEKSGGALTLQLPETEVPNLRKELSDTKTRLAAAEQELSDMKSPKIATDGDIEVKATYSSDNFKIKYTFEGTVSNTGNAAATKVELWWRLKGFTLQNPSTSETLFVPDSYNDTLVGSFRNLRPGEARPIKLIVVRNFDNIQNKPGPGWKLWSDEKTVSSLYAKVAAVKD